MPPIGETKFADLLDALAAKTPAPGGGAVAGAAGALAAALAGMVVSYSLGKRNLAQHQPALEHAARTLASTRRMFLELADEDAAAYAALNDLQKLPEADERRGREMPGAAERSVQVPMAALAGAANLLRHLEGLGPITNRHLASDLAIAAVLAEAAARSAEWNIRVNLPLLADAARRAAVSAQAHALVDEAAGRARRIEAACGS